MTLRLTASLIALSFLAGGVLLAAPASADDSGYRTHRSSVQKRATRITIRKTNTARYDAGYAAGTSYARGYSDGVAAVRATVPPVVTRPYVVYDTDTTYVPPVYPYGAAPAVVAPGYAYQPTVRVIDPVTSAFAAATVPVAVTTPAPAVQGDVAAWIRDCSVRYRQFAPSDFDPASGTFLGNDGDRYYCN